MRPLKLTIQAFGPFLKKVVIPFENLEKNSIYLITGPTGSGKTTIFDAICFALFNQSSGSIRGTNSLRSHFAEDKCESFVELIFEHKGEIYTVIRTPSYERSKLKGNGKIVVNSKAQLTLPNSKLILGVKEVDSYIENLLGINASQFGQIALLAQGEFLKILNSDTQKRGEIFRNIFKTKIYSDFSLKIKDKFDNLKVKHLELKKSFLQYISQINSENEKTNLYIKNYLENECLYNVDEFISLFWDEIKKIKTEIGNLELSIGKLNNEIKDNDLIIGKINEKNTLKKDIDNYNSQLLVLKDNFSVVECKYNNLSTKKRMLDELKIKIEKSDNLLKKINTYYEYKNEFESLNIKKKNIEGDISKIKFEYSKYSYFYYISLKDNLEEKQKEFISLQDIYNECNFKYIELNNKFLSMQAGVLASNLKEGSPCPVCGSKKHPNLAKLDEGVSLDIVESAKKEIDKINADLTNLSLDCSLVKADVEMALDYFNKLLSRFLIVDFDYVNENIKKINKDDFNSEILIFEKNLADKDKLLTEINSKIAAVESAIEIFLKDFDGLDIQEAKSEYIELKKKANNLEDEILSVEKEFFASRQVVSDITSKLEILNNNFLKLDCPIMDVNEIINKNKNLLSDRDILCKQLKTLEYSYNLNKELCSRLKSVYAEFEQVDKSFSHYKALSDLACGSITGKARIAFEQYIQGYYLDLIIFEANKRLKVLSKNQFQLLRKKDSFSGLSKTGLDLEVMDFHTFKTRSTKTLSGGESFKAALCLALGLSDIVSSFSGSVSIDSLFIDEGFGTLDAESLELSMRVISTLSETGRLIGVISHVEDLKYRIENKITVLKSDSGSSVEINF